MANAPVVLVVDHEMTMLNFIRRHLETRGFDVISATDGLDALDVFREHHVDLILMEILIPRLDGLETIRRIRRSSTVPIIVISGISDEHEKLRAFDLGADDYILKPFSISELFGRIKAVLRRARWSASLPPSEIITCDDILVDMMHHRVTVGEIPVELTRTEFNLLVFLMKNTGRVLPHQAILQHVWGPEYRDEAEYLRVYMGKLRQKIENDPINPRHIRTERGIGYQFC